MKVDLSDLSASDLEHLLAIARAREQDPNLPDKPGTGWPSAVEALSARSDPATNAAWDRQQASAQTDLLRRWTMAELLDEPDDFRWLVKGVLVDPTYGQIGGELKTLKSVIATLVAVAVAAGEPLFGHFDVGTARPVVAYVGEGGRKPYMRRLRRIAHAMGVKLDELPLFPVFDVAAIQTDLFRESLARDLRDIEPGLVTLDPLYIYHGTTTRAADLHQEGALLDRLSRPCVEAGVSLQVVNHFNKSGTGVSLQRITMAGSGEWADSWLLLSHRVEPDVENGVFRLAMDVGSRQWGGTTWELDLTLGRFDPDLGEHKGDIKWEIRRASGEADKGPTGFWLLPVVVPSSSPVRSWRGVQTVAWLACAPLWPH